MSRPATLSPSQFKKVMTNGRGSDSFGKTASTYAEEVAMRYCGLPIDEFTSYDIQRGIEMEPFAVGEYEKKYMVEVYGKERIFHPEYDFISGEPDGLVGDDKVIEVKCPNSKNHFANLMAGEQLELYKYQIQGYLWLTGRSVCDFVSYNADYPEDLQLSVHTVERNNDMISELEERCIKFWDELVKPKIKEIAENLEIDNMEIE